MRSTAQGAARGSTPLMRSRQAPRVAACRMPSREPVRVCVGSRLALDDREAAEAAGLTARGADGGLEGVERAVVGKGQVLGGPGRVDPDGRLHGLEAHAQREHQPGRLGIGEPLAGQVAQGEPIADVEAVPVRRSEEDVEVGGARRRGEPDAQGVVGGGVHRGHPEAGREGVVLGDQGLEEGGDGLRVQVDVHGLGPRGHLGEPGEQPGSGRPARAWTVRCAAVRVAGGRPEAASRCAA